MKKLFTLLMAATLSLGSYAKDYTDNLVVSINNSAMPAQPSTISVTAQENGKYTFLLKDFSFSGMKIGDINLTDVEGNTVNGTTYLRTAQTVSVQALGMSLPIILRAEMTDSQLKADMDITGVPGLAIHVTFAGGGDLGGYQIPNSGFEDYYTYNNNIQEPLYWHSFASAGGSLAGTVNGTKHTEPSTEVRPGSTGRNSLKVTSTEINLWVLKIIANGTITTGRMNAGSASPDDPANHAQIDMSSTDKDGHGDPYYVVLNGQPDLLSVWVAFKQGTPNSKYSYATVSAITTDGTYYQDPEDKNKTYTNKRAVAKNDTIATTFTGNTLTWKEVKIPFTEVDKGITPKTILVTMSTNATPGQGSGSDELYIDDLSLIYNEPTVKSISFKGKTLTFNKDSTATENATGTVSTDDFSVETEGALDGHVFKYMSTTKDSEGKDVPVAKIIVTSGDYKKFSTYTINLPGATTTAIHSIATDNNSPAELYNLAGQRINNAQPGQVVIVKKGGKAVKVMK